MNSIPGAFKLETRFKGILRGEVARLYVSMHDVPSELYSVDYAADPVVVEFKTEADLMFVKLKFQGFIENMSRLLE